MESLSLEPELKREERDWFAVQLFEEIVLEQLGNRVELAAGDFLAFSHDGGLHSFKEKDFHLSFDHVDDRGKNIYTFKGADNTLTELSLVSTRSDDDDQKPRICSPKDSLPLLILNDINSAKWIQRDKIVSVFLIYPLSIKVATSRTLCGNAGDVLIVHECGNIENILTPSTFIKHFSFLQNEDNNELEVSVDDEIAVKIERDSVEHDKCMMEVRRRCPVLAKKMTTPFRVSREGYSGTGEIGDFLIQQSCTMLIDDVESFIPPSTIQQTPGKTSCRENLDGFCQWILKSSEIEKQFMRIETEKVLMETEDAVKANANQNTLLNKNCDCNVSEDLKEDECPYKLLPATAFLPHYKCWEGLVMKRSRITGQWKSYFATLYPNRLSFGKEIQADSKEVNVANLSDACKIPVESFYLTYCSVFPSSIEDKDAVFLENAKANEFPDKHRHLKPFSSNEKVAVSPARAIGQWFHGRGETDSELVSSFNGIYLCATSLTSHTFLTILRSSVIYCRREMVFQATKAGNSLRVLEILRSVCIDDAVFILKTMYPFESSPGVLLQHEAAKSSPDLMKTLFPKEGQVENCPFQLDVAAFSCSGLMCLHYAVLSDNLEVVQHLEHFGMTANTRAMHGKTPLHLVKSKEMAIFLLSQGARLDLEDEEGNNALMSLILLGHFEAITTLLEHIGSMSNDNDDKFSINSRSWKTGRSALSYAIRNLNSNSIELVKLLLRHGADPNSTDVKNNTCLHESVLSICTLAKAYQADHNMQLEFADCVKIMSLLVDYGADIMWLNDDERTPFLLLCQMDYLPKISDSEKAFELLSVDKSGRVARNDIVGSPTVDGSYPIHIVTRSANCTLLEYIIGTGVNINAKDINGCTPLDLIHDMQSSILPCTPLPQIGNVMQCLRILTENKALKRIRKNIPMEVDQPKIKFIPSSSQFGLYEVKSATLEAMIKRLCNEYLYNDLDAEALLIYLTKSDPVACDELLGFVMDCYPRKLYPVKEEKEELDGEYSPRGILFFLCMWFDVNIDSIDFTNERFFDMLKALISGIIDDYSEVLSNSSLSFFSSGLEFDDFDDLLCGFKTIQQTSVEPKKSVSCHSDLVSNQARYHELQHLIDKFKESNWSIKSFRLLGLDNDPSMSILTHSPLEISQQASCMQHYLHTLIEDDEIMSMTYHDLDACPNINTLRQWNERVMKCFISEILSIESAKRRAETVCRILDIGHRALEDLNNFELAVVVLGVIECAAVYRLKKTWLLVEKMQPDSRKNFKSKVGIGGRNIKALMQNVDPPLVPYLGAILQQIINLHEMPSTYNFEDCHDSHINMSKFRNLLKIRKQHKKLKARYFNLLINPVTQEFLQKPTMLNNEDLFLRRSLQLEPTE